MYFCSKIDLVLYRGLCHHYFIYKMLFCFMTSNFVVYAMVSKKLLFPEFNMNIFHSTFQIQQRIAADTQHLWQTSSWWGWMWRAPLPLSKKNNNAFLYRHKMCEKHITKHFVENSAMKAEIFRQPFDFAIFSTHFQNGHRFDPFM